MGDEAETIVVSAAPKGRCRARVTVRDGDSLRPLKGAHVEVWSVDAGDTDASGVWKSRGFAAGTYDVKVFLACHGPKPPEGQARKEWTWILSVTFPDSAVPTEVNVLLVTGLPVLVATVTDPARGGAPVSGAEVEIAGRQTGRTESDGTYTSPPFEAGTYDVKVRKPGYGAPGDKSPTVGEVVRSMTFSSAGSVAAAFELTNVCGRVSDSNIRIGNEDFVTWFNGTFRKNVPKQIPDLKVAEEGFPENVKSADFQHVFDSLARLWPFGADLSLEEFVGLFVAMYVETGFHAKSERGSLRYFFEPGGAKCSYNKRPDNRLAGDQLPTKLPPGVVLSQAEIAAWNMPGPYPAPNADATRQTAIEAAATECDFNKFRGRGLIQITWRSNYKSCVVPALRAHNVGPVAVADNDAFLDAITDAELHQAMLNDDIQFEASKAYFASRRSSFSRLNQQDWRRAGAGINAGEYPKKYEWRCTRLLEQLEAESRTKKVELHHAP